MDYRLELLTMREQVMENIDALVDQFYYELYGEEKNNERDQLVTMLCDMVSETIDPAGF